MSSPSRPTRRTWLDGKLQRATCDEPAFKGILGLTVDAPADRMAVSNMPVASTEALGNRRKRVHFEPTPKMSTYLYFLAVGDFERTTTHYLSWIWLSHPDR